MEEGFKQGRCTALKNFGSNPIDFHGFSAVRALNTSVAEKEMSLRVMGCAVCVRAMGIELGGLIVNTE